MRTLPGGDQSALRGLNTRRVLQFLYESRSQTVTSVAKETGLSRPTVVAILNSLVEAGMLVLDGHDSVPTGGRPAQRYRFRWDAGLLAGIDIGAHAVAARITDLGGAPLGSARRQLSEDTSPAERVEAAAALVAQVIGADPRPLWGAGVGTPGIIDETGVVRLSVAIPGWTGVRLAADLRERLECPVFAMKDTAMAVVAEHRVGVARDVSDLLYVHVGHRLGVGLLVDGKPFVGQSGAAGEVGRHPIFGWNEAPGRLADTEGPSDLPESELHERVFARAARGDETAVAAVDAFARSLASGIAAMILAVDPRLVVIGGGVARAGAVLLDPIARHLSGLLYDVPPLALSALGDDAVNTGAVEVARDQLRSHLFDSA